MRYYIADQHFFHEGLNEHMDRRGFGSLEEMHNYMIRQWNLRVRKNDEVVILGDFSVGKAEETNKILEQLNGRLYMIKGNHDRWLSDASANTKRFVWVKDYAEMHDNGRKVILSHYPILFYNGQYRRSKSEKALTYMLHGHIHDTVDMKLLCAAQGLTRNTSVKSKGLDEARPIPSNLVNCFCMYSDYVPLTLDEWIAVQENVEMKLK